MGFRITEHCGLKVEGESKGSKNPNSQFLLVPWLKFLCGPLRLIHLPPKTLQEREQNKNKKTKKNFGR